MTERSFTILGCCDHCWSGLPVTGTSAELVKGIEADCSGCGARYRVGWKHERRGDHGGVVQKRI